MRSDKSLILMLVLAACDGPTPTRASADVLSMSRDAVAVQETVLDPVPVVVSEPSVESEPFSVLVEPMAVFTLRHGETLDHFARWSGHPVEDIAAFSGLSLDGAYAVGTTIQLPLDEAQVASLDLARAEHWSRRLHGYLASRGGAIGTDFYEVRTGDSAWGIARSNYAIPMWVLEMYNPSVDLDRLRPGQDLMVPRLADTVVDAHSEIPELTAPIAQ